jgi:hypothetical protein
MKTKKCPPGIICIENMTMITILVVLLFGGMWIMRSSLNETSRTSYQYYNRPPTNEVIIHEQPALNVRPNYGYTNLPGDVLMNPYVPPVGDEGYIRNGGLTRGYGVGIPVNVSTNLGAVNTDYRQMGILTPLHGKGEKANILPLMGRPLFVSRDKWQYYSMSDQKNTMKLPIRKNGRSCTSEYGVDKLYNGDIVYVEGYNQGFKVTTYETDTLQYIPFI